MTDWLLLASHAVVPLAVILLGLWTSRLTSFALTGMALLSLLWLGTLTAVDEHWLDAGMDCWPYCTPYQAAVNTVIFFAPPVILLLLLVALGSSTLDRRRTAKKRAGSMSQLQ